MHFFVLFLGCVLHGLLSACTLSHLSDASGGPRSCEKLGPVLNFELWRSHIKQVEGHFGTAVASYFVLLRWLFYMNMAIFGVWTLFVSIPQFVVEPYLAAQKAALRPYIFLNNSNYTCSTNKSNESTYIILPSCKTLPRNPTTAKYCPSNGNQSVTLKVFDFSKNSTLKQVRLPLWTD